MPIYKRCSRCNRRVAVGGACGCVDKRYIENRRHIKPSKENQFYFTYQWQKARSAAAGRFFGLDIYSYYTENIIEFGETVHHIVPLKDDFSKRFDIKNLIFLTESNHQSIHSAMKQNEAEKKKIILHLQALINRFYTEFYG